MTWFWIVIATVALIGAALGERGVEWLYSRQERAVKAGRTKLAAALSVAVVFAGGAAFIGKQAGIIGEIATHEVTQTPRTLSPCQIDPESPGCPNAPYEPLPLDHEESTP
jgi:hypothetical protein